MKMLLAAVAAVAVLGTGCVIVPARANHRSEASGKRCPPGHEWSDGRCHDQGKGHDPAKRRR
jgi:hypothetical protein